MTRRILRMLGWVDDLLEVIVFDVLLATRRRRVASFVLGALTALLLYATSGLWLTSPPAISEPAPDAFSLERRPMELSLDDPDGLVYDFAAGIGRTDRAREKVRMEAARHRLALDSAVEVTRSGLRFESASDVPFAIQLSSLLTARGRLHQESGDDDAAVADWVAVVRLASAIGSAPVQGYGMFLALVSHSNESSALALLEELAASGRLTAGRAQTIRVALASRPAAVRLLAEGIREEARAVCRHLEVYGEKNVMPSHISWRVQLYLPWRDSSRRALAKTLAARIHERFEDVANTLETTAPGGSKLQQKWTRPGFASRWGTMIAGIFSIDAAARVLVQEQVGLPFLIGNHKEAWSQDQRASRLDALCADVKWQPKR